MAATETEALLEGLEVIPRRARRLQGPDASRRWTSTPSCARRPQLVLVDELAHTNAPGSRHPKRYMDVEELLAAGIDVYTTLNIQHVESLNDVVAQITRIRVRETVPDSIIDRADEIEVVDLTPDDLIQRLQGGQGLCPATGRARAAALFPARQPDRAARAGAAPHRAARRRADGRLHARACDRGPWAAGERVLVCVERGPDAAGAGALRPPAWPTGCARRGRRSISRPRARQRLSEAERDRIAEASAAGRTARRRGGHRSGHERSPRT